MNSRSDAGAVHEHDREPRPCGCFWNGGFVFYTAFFIAGVLLTLTLGLKPLADMVGVQYSQGACEVGCMHRRLGMAILDERNRCMCDHKGHKIRIDPYDVPEHDPSEHDPFEHDTR